jgi:hypothetical protein
MFDARVHYAHLNQQPTTTPTENTYRQNDGLPSGWQSLCSENPNPPKNGVACFFRIQQGVLLQAHACEDSAWPHQPTFPHIP